LVHPLERIVDRLSRAWGTVSHLKAVKDSEELRKVGNRAYFQTKWIGGAFGA
jgi:Zn-dependent oligopeptidase